MLKFSSKFSEYAIRALVIMANENWRVSVRYLSNKDNLPLHFTRKAMQILARNKIVEGVRGPQGGYILKKHPSRIRIIDILKIFDNFSNSNACPLGTSHCSANSPCLIRVNFNRLREKFYEKMKEITLEDISFRS